MTEESMEYFYRINSIVLEKFEKKSVYFTRPRLVGLYDIDYENFTPAKRVRYHFKAPRLVDYPLDLNEGTATLRFLEHGTEINLLRVIFHAISLGTATSNDDTITNDVELSEVYTRRGIVENIMEFCYSHYDFNVLVSRYNGKLYMIRQELQLEEFQRETVCGHHTRLSQLLFVDADAGHGHGNGDDNVFQIALHQSTLGKYKIIYAGRVQGVVASGKSCNSGDLNDLNKEHFVLAKQMWSTIKNRNQKLLRYWLQAYLSNSSDLYLAVKDDKAIVRQPLERMKTCDIPKKCFWKPGICTTFLCEFLKKVEQLMSNVNSLDTVYNFKFNAKEKTIHYKMYKGKTEMSFIPREYADLI